MNPTQIIILAFTTAALGIATTGCGTASAANPQRSTPLALTGPMNVSGPVSVTGPITVSGPITTVGNGDTSSTSTTEKSTPTARAVPRAVTRAAVATAVDAALAAPTSVADGTEIELKKEDMTVQKNVVSNGQVIIRKTVISEQATIPITTQREEYEVVRVAADGPPTTPWGEAVSVISMPLTRETAIPVITPRVIERIKVRKTTTADAANIVGTVRTEKLDVVKQ